MKREPILTRGAVVAAVTVLLNLLVAFGLDLTQEQRDAIMDATTVVSPLVVLVGTWLWSRGATTPWREVVLRRSPDGGVVDGPAR